MKEAHSAVPYGYGIGMGIDRHRSSPFRMGKR